MLPPGFANRSLKKSSRVDIAINILDEFLISVDNFMTKEECKSWIEFADSVTFEKLDLRATKYNANRYHERFQYHDDNLATNIFRRVLEFIPSSIDGLSPIGCSTNIRFYKYNKGDVFGPHIDESNLVDGGITKFTLLIYLTSSYPEVTNLLTVDKPSKGNKKKIIASSSSAASSLSSTQEGEKLIGGETVFYSDHRARRDDVFAVITPREGRLVLHGHGDRCRTHESRIIKNGVKYVLRTDVIYGSLSK
jgi:hypothetical protein